VTIRLYLDEDAMDRILVRALRARGVDVQTAHELEMIHREDQEHLDCATSHSRVLFSFKIGDFCRLHADFLTSGKSHAGIIVARQQHYSVGEQMRRLLKLIARKTAEEMHNHVEFLSDWD
jgi:hypothetical protein